MKALLTLSLLLLFAIKVNAQQFTLTGKITVPEPGINLFFMYTDNKGNNVKDSCQLTDGTFTFKGNISEPTKAYLAAFKEKFKWRDDSDPNSANIFLDPAKMTVTGIYNHLHDLAITGSEDNTLFQKLQKVPVKNLMQYINTYPGIFFLDVYKGGMPLSSVEGLLQFCTPRIKASRSGKEITDYINKTINSSLGKTAENFTSTDLNGKQIGLADFKGKVVLLDFWASWCIPCRASTPHLIKTYNKYHKSGLEVIAVSDDDFKPKAWKDAVAKDKSGLWTNVLRGMPSEYGQKSPNDINDKYAVTVLPTRILINKEGVIVGRYVGTNETAALDKKLAELFGNKD